jgi:trafficking protein particle complex subunit 10
MDWRKVSRECYGFALSSRIITLELLQADHSALSINIPSSDARLAGDQDGSYLDVVITNHLPCVRDEHSARMFWILQRH